MEQHDEIFENLEKIQQEDQAEKITTEDIVLIDSEGRAKKATPELLVRTFALHIIVIAIALAIGLFGILSPMYEFLRGLFEILIIMMTE